LEQGIGAAAENTLFRAAAEIGNWNVAVDRFRSFVWRGCGPYAWSETPVGSLAQLFQSMNDWGDVQLAEPLRVQLAKTLKLGDRE